MNIKEYCYDGKQDIDLKNVKCSENHDKKEKAEILEKTKKNLIKIAEIQDKMFAEAREGIIFVLQARDAAGKDSTVKHIMTGINPQGVEVYGFKQPTHEEQAHDFMWRFAKCLPKRGKIAIFNRSYYEDVLVVKVHELQKGYRIPKRCVNDSFFEKRYKHIKNYEEMLYDNGYRIIKVFLNVSRDTQKKRFLERIDLPNKNWKFSSADLREREFWDEYTDAYEKTINNTASQDCPWYVVPADQKWYARYIISQIFLDCMEDMHADYPELPEEEVNKLQECKRALLEENEEDEQQKKKKEKAE